MDYSRKTVGTERVKLLTTFLEMDIPVDLQKKIAKHIGSLEIPEREQRAKEINEMLRKCTTEEEVTDIFENILPYYDSSLKQEYKYDPIEDTDEYKAVVDEVDKLAQEKVDEMVREWEQEHPSFGIQIPTGHGALEKIDAYINKM